MFFSLTEDTFNYCKEKPLNLKYLLKLKVCNIAYRFRKKVFDFYTFGKPFNLKILDI